MSKILVPPGVPQPRPIATVHTCASCTQRAKYFFENRALCFQHMALARNEAVVRYYLRGRRSPGREG